ncbi:glycosyltransferase [Kitasatospora sp. NPDC017646]|uniref:glycosyltransferase n=1 Tax=Kitasatospora sp. NPDC017646 TaxID=3364024 RepID=UPI00378CCD30
MTDPRPRIALVLQGQAHQGGGVATSVLRLARGLDRDGRFAVDVVALCPALPAPPGADPVPTEPVETDGGVRFYELRPSAALPAGAACELAVQQALVELTRRHRHALLHGFYVGKAGYQAAWAAAECGVRLVVGIRGNDIYGDVFGSKALPRLQWALDRATRIIAVSSEAARRADILTGCGSRTTVVLNSITTDHYRLGVVRTPGAPVIGTLGKLRSKKGVDLLVRAFPTVLEQHPDARLLLAGEINDDDAALPELVSFLGIAERTTFTGPVPREDALRHLRGMDVFVLSSLHDGCPNAVLEAMAAGTWLPPPSGPFPRCWRTARRPSSSRTSAHGEPWPPGSSPCSPPTGGPSPSVPARPCTPASTWLARSRRTRPSTALASAEPMSLSARFPNSPSKSSCSGAPGRTCSPGRQGPPGGGQHPHRPLSWYEGSGAADGDPRNLVVVIDEPARDLGDPGTRGALKVRAGGLAPGSEEPDRPVPQAVDDDGEVGDLTPLSVLTGMSSPPTRGCSGRTQPCLVAPRWNDERANVMAALFDNFSRHSRHRLSGARMQ